MDNISQSLNEVQIENAIMEVCSYVESQETTMRNWDEYSEEGLWFELVSCILGSRVRHETARGCAVHLNRRGLLDIPKLLKNPLNLEKKLELELDRPIYPPFSNSRGTRYRYPRSKSKCIVNSGINIYGNRLTVKGILLESDDGVQARAALVKKCCGIGHKQASLFLRNVSFTDDLAILDCHVMNFIEMLNLDENSRIFSEDKVSAYTQKENMLRLYALSKKRKLASLDVGIWTVMRLAKRRNAV